MLSAKNRTARRRLDQRLAELAPLSNIKAPPKGWLRAIRDSLGMTAAQAAKRLGVSASQSVEDIERSEAAGTVRLDTLRRAAASLDCTLVYAIVPNHSLDEMVGLKARDKALAALSRVDQTMLLEDQRVAATNREELIADYIAEHIRDRDLWE
jgi:predicted DNA-binding mobile mystery protein A